MPTAVLRDPPPALVPQALREAHSAGDFSLALPSADPVFGAEVVDPLGVEASTEDPVPLGLVDALGIARRGIARG